jgi:hypothetical protein
MRRKGVGKGRTTDVFLEVGLIFFLSKLFQLTLELQKMLVIAL